MVDVGRPTQGLGHYLRDIVYGGLDGSITTLAVIASVAGANLGLRVAVIVGLANLVADGLSMGASNFLGLKSDLEQRGESVRAEMPWRHGAATGIAFVVTGAIPLLAYVVTPIAEFRMVAAGIATAVVLFVVGAGRARFVGKAKLRSGVEMLVVGGLAGGAAFAIGAFARALI